MESGLRGRCWWSREDRLIICAANRDAGILLGIPARSHFPVAGGQGAIGSAVSWRIDTTASTAANWTMRICSSRSRAGERRRSNESWLPPSPGRSRGRGDRGGSTGDIPADLRHPGAPGMGSRHDHCGGARGMALLRPGAQASLGRQVMGSGCGSGSSTCERMRTSNRSLTIPPVRSSCWAAVTPWSSTLAATCTREAPA